MEENIINHMIQLCHNFYQKKLVCSTGGNISIRIGEYVYITSTAVSLENANKDNLVKLDLSGKVISSGNPSKEWQMHLKIYQTNNNCQIVVHIHSAYIVAASCMSKSNTIMPAFTPGYASRIGNVKILPFYIPGTEQLSKAVSEESRKSKAVILMNHGLVTWGKDLEKIGYIIEEIVENAKIFTFTKGKGSSLSKKEINMVRNQVY